MRTTPARLAVALLYLLTACQQPPMASGTAASRATRDSNPRAANVAPAAAPRSSAAPQQTRPELAREFRAAWVATVDNIDWPSRPGLPTAQARAELDAIVARAADLKLNALVFQVRPAADAMYPSKLEPWSEWLTGAQGKAPDEKWDPLAYVIDACHREGLQLHAWFNPYRAAHPAGKSTPAKNHVLNMMPNVCVTYGKYRWMDPGDQRAADWSLAVIRDVVKRYDVDGVHIDDYFYPYPETVKGKGKSKDTLLEFPDQRSFARYQKGGGKLARDDWRRANIDAFVQQMYDTVHREKPWVQVGISPFGIARPGVPAGIKAGIDQFGQLYADVPKWLEKGWLDYLSPQLYWPIDQAPQSFAVLLPWWHAQNPRKRHMWPGINPGRMIEGKAPIRPDELTAQMELLRAQKASQGHVHYSFKALRRDAPNVAGALRSSLYATPAIAPASPWLGTDAVAAPVVRWDGPAVTWEAATSAQFVAVQVQTKHGWTTHRVVGASVGRCALPADAVAVAITAIGRTGVVSSAAMSARN